MEGTQSSLAETPLGRETSAGIPAGRLPRRFNLTLSFLALSVLLVIGAWFAVSRVATDVITDTVVEHARHEAEDDAKLVGAAFSMILRTAQSETSTDLTTVSPLSAEKNINAVSAYLAGEGAAEFDELLTAIDFIHMGLHTSTGQTIWSSGNMIGMKNMDRFRDVAESGVLSTELTKNFQTISQSGEPKTIDFVESFALLDETIGEDVKLIIHLQRDETEVLVEGVVGLRNSLFLRGLIALGSILGILGIFIAVSDHRLDRASRRLLDQERVLVGLKTTEAERLHRIDQAKNEFLSTLSHELKTPLAAMSGFLYIMQKNKKGNLDDQDLDRLGIVARNGKRLDSMISDLLNLAQIENENMTLNKQWFDISELATDISVSFELIVADKQQTIICNSPDIPVWFYGDRDRLAQVMTNLVSNASKYSGAGTSITIESSISGDLFNMEVHDQGSGIKPEDIDSLGTLFYRTDDAINSSTQGTGIGLYLSKKITSLHGGEIEINSEYEQGSTVKFTLPGATIVGPEDTSTTQPKTYTSRFDDLESAV